MILHCIDSVGLISYKQGSCFFLTKRHGLFFVIVLHCCLKVDLHTCRTTRKLLKTNNAMTPAERTSSLDVTTRVIVLKPEPDKGVDIATPKPACCYAQDNVLSRQNIPAFCYLHTCVVSVQQAIPYQKRNGVGHENTSWFLYNVRFSQVPSQRMDRGEVLHLFCSLPCLMRARVGMERSERGGAERGSGGATTGRSTTPSTVMST